MARSKKNDVEAGPPKERGYSQYEGLDEYTALQKYLATYRDPRDATTDDSDKQMDTTDKKKSWALWKRGDSQNGTGSDAGVVPENWLDAHIRGGISTEDVESRRKKFGWNEITTESTNLFVQFLSYFRGPILYGEPPHTTRRGNN